MHLESLGCLDFQNGRERERLRRRNGGRRTYLVHVPGGLVPDSGMVLEPAQREVKLENSLIGRVDIASLNENALLVKD